MKSSRSGRSQRGGTAWGLDRGMLGRLGGVRSEEDGGKRLGGTARKGGGKSEERSTPEPAEGCYPTCTIPPGEAAEEGENQGWTDNANIADDLDKTGSSGVEDGHLITEGSGEREEGRRSKGGHRFCGVC